MGKKNYLRTSPDKHLDRRLRTALGSIIHTQAAIKAAMDQAEGFMSEPELANNKAYCELCHFDAQCETAFQVLCNELKGGEA